LKVLTVSADTTDYSRSVLPC